MSSESARSSIARFRAPQSSGGLRRGVADALIHVRFELGEIVDE
jgi:hypothetical protein